MRSREPPQWHASSTFSPTRPSPARTTSLPTGRPREMCCAASLTNSSPGPSPLPGRSSRCSTAWAGPASRPCARRRWMTTAPTCRTRGATPSPLPMSIWTTTASPPPIPSSICLRAACAPRSRMPAARCRCSTCTAWRGMAAALATAASAPKRCRIFSAPSRRLPKWRVRSGRRSPTSPPRSKLSTSSARPVSPSAPHGRPGVTPSAFPAWS